MYYRTNRLIGDSPKDPSGFTERVKEIKKPETEAKRDGYVGERMTAESAVLTFYSKTIPINHVDGTR